MTDTARLRWHLRLATFRRAVDLLEEAVGLGRERALAREAVSLFERADFGLHPFSK